MPKRISDPKKRVKREDVAVEAGVSTATVSYVLNRTKRLSPEVEQRVLETAARLNYIPNRIAQSLARNKTNALALITADITNVYQLDVIKGLQAEALKNDYIVYIVPCIEYGSWPYSSSEELGGRLMEQMLEKHPDVTAVIATNDLMAIGAMKAAQDMGLDVPGKISVIGVDNIDKSSVCDPPLTTLDQCGKEYGKKIFHVLHENICEQTSGKYVIPMRLIRRGSTGPAFSEQLEKIM